MKTDWDYKQFIKDAARAVWCSIARRFWYKLLSVVIAVFVWSYAITSNPTLARDKWVDVEVRITGQAALTSRNLALLTDVSASISTARVRVSVPQQSFQSVTTQNVTAELDLSTVRNKGKQQVKLRPSSVLGTAQSVQPDTIEIEVDDLAERNNVPVSVRREGEREGYWYNDRIVDPARINIKGPASIVQRVSSASLPIDVSQFTATKSAVGAPVFTDAAGEAVDHRLLTVSTSQVFVTLDIYPQKLLPVSVDPQEVVPGELPKGYAIDGVEVQPSSILIAAPPELLDNMTSVQIQPIDITGKKQPFSVKTNVIELDDVKNYSAKSVNISVDINEELKNEKFQGLKVQLIGLDETRFKATWSNPRVDTWVTDRYSIVTSMKASDLRAFVDLSAINEVGAHELPIYVVNDDYPELGISVVPQTVTVTITDVK